MKVCSLRRHYDQVHFHFIILNFSLCGQQLLLITISFNDAQSKDHVSHGKNRMNKIIYDAALMREKKIDGAAMFCSASTVVSSVVSFSFICNLIKAIK